MKRKLTYLFFALLCCARLGAQSRQLPLSGGSVQLFAGNLYVYGFVSNSSNAIFRIYKMNVQLKTLDSLQLELGKNTDSYLQISADTLHNYLNVYLQKKEKKLVNVLRFNKKFELVANVPDVDIARLNSISAFENELLYAGNCVYTIKTQADSTGLQFYLNKFTLKSPLKNFDYEFSWQFAFERRYVNSAHIFYADRRVVLLYVNVNEGPKTGQWMLCIHAATGKLFRGTKLGDKGETNTYEFGSFIADSSKKTLTLVGQKLMDNQLSISNNKLNIANAPTAFMYLIEIDSLGEISNKQEFKIPISEPKPTSKKLVNNFIFRVSQLRFNNEGKLTIEADIFKNSDNTLSYLYVNSSVYKLALNDELKLAIEKSSLSSNSFVEKFYGLPDKSDRNGKVAVDSLDEFEKLFYKPLTFPVKQAFKVNDDNSMSWVLKKSNPKKNSIAYSLLAPVKNVYQLNTIEEMSTAGNPAFTPAGKSNYILSKQLDDKTYQLKIYSW